MTELDWLHAPAALIPLTALLGLLVGSFLNVVILRLPRRLEHEWRSQAHEMLDVPRAGDAGEAPPDLVFTGSHCPHCRHKLSPLDNIPLLSWLALRGRCRYCKAPISWQYPLVELLSALASAAIAWKFGFGWPLAAGLVFTWMLIAASGIDARTQLLPDQLTLPLLWLGLLIALVPLFVTPEAAIVGAAIGYLSLWSVFWLFKLTTGKEGMGYGDFKLLGALGAWMGATALLPIILLSSLIGAIVGGTVLALRGQDRSTPIPFGPFIAAAGWAWFVFGDRLGGFYARLFGLG
ncbi:MAG: prepilin peptidase [Rhodanobacteraceae bacterium]|jgi:leader peptidase (prepilin peptidase)/N-methyltransferase|nr:prepilin peptidase [Rhodanobacteraceae bacterium]